MACKIVEEIITFIQRIMCINATSRSKCKKPIRNVCTANRTLGTRKRTRFTHCNGERALYNLEIDIQKQKENIFQMFKITYSRSADREEELLQLAIQNILYIYWRNLHRRLSCFWALFLSSPASLPETDIELVLSPRS